MGNGLQIFFSKANLEQNKILIITNSQNIRQQNQTIL
jgi:hypothetical protein